jgi:hypothetical protein
MSLLFRMLRFCAGGCRHRHTFRERRELHGTMVLHLVCEDCGRAVPAIQRTAEEHVEVVRNGAIRPIKVRRMPPELVAVGTRRREKRVAS